MLALAVPQTWKGGRDQSKEKSKRIPDSTAFSPRTLSSLGDFVCCFFSANGAVPVYEAAALGNQGGYKSQQRGWDHFARRLPSPEGLLAQSLENYVIFNRDPPTHFLGRRVSNLEALSGVRTQSRRETDAV